jgi:hypothetical protein
MCSTPLLAPLLAQQTLGKLAHQDPDRYLTCTGNGNDGAACTHVIICQPTCTGNGNGGAAGMHVILSQPTCSGNGNGGTAGIHVLIVVQLVLYPEGALACLL